MALTTKTEVRFGPFTLEFSETTTTGDLTLKVTTGGGGHPMDLNPPQVAEAQYTLSPADLDELYELVNKVHITRKALASMQRPGIVPR